MRETRGWEVAKVYQNLKSNTTTKSNTRNTSSTTPQQYPLFSLFFYRGWGQKRKNRKKEKPRSPLVFNPGGEGEGKVRALINGKGGLLLIYQGSL